ncbi:MAG: T9SS type A sorting domain-containing protein [candidate division Zixibacteria bacterium]|nr:T9SS type A sorting domain-containing protein [candidate division Zixibacteria bacterium]
MRKTFIISAFLAMVVIIPASASIVYVPGDQPTIQTGIVNSMHGDTVLVAPGIYEENISFNAQIITLGSLYLTTGDTAYISSTRIDGRSSGSVVTISNHGENTASLIGFTIQNGVGSYGGGVSCVNSSPVIANNVVTACTGTYGGGIYCNNSDAMIRDNTISGNSGLYGGGVCIYQNGAVLSNNLIEDNSALDWGGGILIQSSECDISMNTVQNNSAVSGGGIYYFYSNGTTSNNIIRDNSSTNGAGIFCESSSPTMTNNTVYSNSASSSGGGIYCKLASSPVITNSIFWHDSAGVAGHEVYEYGASPQFSYCDVQGDWGGESNIDIDPLFRDPEGMDLHLMAVAYGYPYDSPCIDVGHPDIWDLTVDGEWGCGTYLCDLGAYGGRDVAHLLPPPVLVSPYDGEQIEEFTPTLSWLAEPGADEYEIMVDDAIDFLIPDRQGNSEDAQWTVTPELEFGVWYWRVRSRNQLGWGEWSEGWSFSIGPTDVDDSPGDLVAGEYTLGQCYPNPFNARTTIVFGLPEAGHVTIDIYDMLGKKVETLLNGYHEAGFYQVNWNAAGQSSGLYLYRIQSGNYSDTRRMLLLK